MPKKKNPKFLRRNWSKRSRLGQGRKKKQVWRRATGRHNKIREKRKGYPIRVMIGFRNEKAIRDTIKEKKIVFVSNMKELEMVKKGEIAIIKKVGNRKKLEMLKKAKEKGIAVQNLNVNKILKNAEKKKQKIEAETEKMKSSKEHKEAKK